VWQIKPSFAIETRSEPIQLVFHGFSCLSRCDQAKPSEDFLMEYQCSSGAGGVKHNAPEICGSEDSEAKNQS